MKNLIIGLFVFGLTTQMFSQVIHLSEVDITALNHKYLSSVVAGVEDIDVKMLQKQAANYDITESEGYTGNNTLYFMSFIAPDGKIIADYDRNGKILRTIERFEDVKLPEAVRNSIFKNFPNWVLSKDVYRVHYDHKKGVTKNEYKMKLTNSRDAISITMDENGNTI